MTIIEIKATQSEALKQRKKIVLFAIIIKSLWEQGLSVVLNAKET